MRKQLTAEETAARDARRAKFRRMWKQVAAMPELERVTLANKLGFVNVDGHEFSLCNAMLLALQKPTGSVFGGFKQWIKQGRAVCKGEHGAMIWVPIGVPKLNGEAQAEEHSEANSEDVRFVIGTVFDVSQTQEIENGQRAAAHIT